MNAQILPAEAFMRQSDDPEGVSSFKDDKKRIAFRLLPAVTKVESARTSRDMDPHELMRKGVLLRFGVTHGTGASGVGGNAPAIFADPFARA
jgi:hypothetical protein